MRRILLAAFVFLAAQASAFAQERILQYVSEVVVMANGDLEVAETITVRAEQDRVKRGILRNIVTTRTDEAGKRTAGKIQVLSVTRFGQPENFTVEELENGVRIRIGSADRLLAKNDHIYTVRYRATNFIRFLPSHDELIWDVTGSGGTLDIDEVQASIELPLGAKVADRVAFTGPKDSATSHAQIFAESEYRVVWRTAERLKAGEGLRVRVTWQKGIVGNR